MSAENSGNLWAVGALSRTPLWELTALHQHPLAGGEGVAAPQKPHPHSRFCLPDEKSWVRRCLFQGVKGKGACT